MALLRRLLHERLKSVWQWKGKDDDGVPIGAGREDAPPLWMSLLPILWAVFVPVYMVLVCGFSARNAYVWLGMIGVAIGSIMMACLGIWHIRLRQRLMKMKPEEEICRQLNVDEATLRQVVRQRGIRPQYRINGRYFYAP